MGHDNTQTQMRKGILEFCILSIIAKEEAYTYTIFQQLHKADLLIVEGTLYPMLSRLRKSGYITHRWQESSQGPPRKYYSLTKSGKNFLKQLEESWLSLIRAIEKVRNLSQENETPPNNATDTHENPSTHENPTN